MLCGLFGHAGSQGETRPKTQAHSPCLGYPAEFAEQSYEKRVCDARASEPTLRWKARRMGHPQVPRWETYQGGPKARRAGPRVALFLAEQNYFAGDLGLFEEFVGARGFAQRHPGGDDRLNLACGEHGKELGEIFSEPVRMGVALRFDIEPDAMLAIGHELHQT